MDNTPANSLLKLEQLVRATDSIDLSEFADFVSFAQTEQPNYEDRSAKLLPPMKN